MSAYEFVLQTFFNMFCFNVFNTVSKASQNASYEVRFDSVYADVSSESSSPGVCCAVLWSSP